METHLILCCNSYCRDREMSKEYNRMSLGNLPFKVSINKGMIITENAQYIFKICDDEIGEQIRGYHIDSYRFCGNVVLPIEVKQYLDIHLKEGGNNEIIPV